jgi:uncharacterized protein YqgC (DUF456 family)
MKEKLIAEILTCIKKAMIIALIGMLFPISSPILFIGLGLWIYIPMYDRYMKEVKVKEKEIEDKKRKKKDNN